MIYMYVYNIHLFCVSSLNKYKPHDVYKRNSMLILKIRYRTQCMVQVYKFVQGKMSTTYMSVPFLSNT